MRHECFASSEARPMPRLFGLKLAPASSLTAVMTKTLLPHTTGLACERPGTGVFQRTLNDFAASHETGRGRPSATPEALGPRNEGQFCPPASETAARQRTRQPSSERFIIRAPSTSVLKSPGGAEEISRGWGRRRAPPEQTSLRYFAPEGRRK